jgi:N-acetylglucosamine kinase-like BadF-type ATPase
MKESLNFEYIFFCLHEFEIKKLFDYLSKKKKSAIFSSLANWRKDFFKKIIEKIIKWKKKEKIEVRKYMKLDKVQTEIRRRSKVMGNELIIQVVQKLKTTVKAGEKNTLL